MRMVALALVIVAGLMAVVGLTVYLTLTYGSVDRGGGYGRFEGPVEAQWDGARDMTLTRDFAYVDPRGKRWLAPKGSSINGASIPKKLWSITGGPYEGRYREASVVHDVACVEMSEPWQDVHLMFYEACRCGGMSERDAKILYCAVYNGGPRWQEVIEPQAGPNSKKSFGSRMVITPAQDLTEEQLTAIADYIDMNNPDVGQIPGLKVEHR